MEAKATQGAFKSPPQTQRCVPKQDRTRKVEGRDETNMTHPRIVALHHEVTWTLGRENSATDRII
ncbi:hypothetical protein PsorP6_009963 [Peronosclerospora sorghi]|uniref:Uncharacterized protein n=1 Tax=Peronosclerospora sorghi TaxID=230839 RepID=A0ACC0VXI3_9STRA|nr:hypothetical protein PsorP6_009963 [Peronosclerospora sorghi]